MGQDKMHKCMTIWVKVISAPPSGFGEDSGSSGSSCCLATSTSSCLVPGSGGPFVGVNSDVEWEPKF